MPRRGNIAACCVLLVFRRFLEASGMPARQGNNLKYFKRLLTGLQIGLDIVPFFHTACLPFMHCGSPTHRRHSHRQRGPRPLPDRTPDLISEPEKPSGGLIDRDVLTSSAEPIGEVTRLPWGLASEFPYKLLTIRITPSFCEGIWFAPRLEKNCPAPSALKPTLFCSMKGAAGASPSSKSQPSPLVRGGKARP
jgi:hypothetical protein